MYQIGSGLWGVASGESGLIIQSISYDYSNQQKQVLDRVGEIIGVANYQETCEISVEAWIPSGSAFSTALGNVVTLNNGVPNYLNGGVTAGKTILEQVTVNYNVEDYRQISLRCKYFPYLS